MLNFRHWHIISKDSLISFFGSSSKIQHLFQVHVSLDSDNERLRFANIGTTAEVLLLDFICMSYLFLALCQKYLISAVQPLC